MLAISPLVAGSNPALGTTKRFPYNTGYAQKIVSQLDYHWSVYLLSEISDAELKSGFSWRLSLVRIIATIVCTVLAI